MVNEVKARQEDFGEDEGNDSAKREPDLSGLERAGREAEEEGSGVPIEETIPARP